MVRDCFRCSGRGSGDCAGRVVSVGLILVRWRTSRPPSRCARPSPAAAPQKPASKRPLRPAPAGPRCAANSCTTARRLRCQPYNVSKEHKSAAPGGQTPPQETLVVDSGSERHQKRRPVLARCVPRARFGARPRPIRSIFDQKACVFLTHVLGVSVGQTINIKNSDPTGHNTKIDGRPTNSIRRFPREARFHSRRSRRKPRAAHRSHAASTRGWSPTCCHAKTATYAVTDDEGRFEIANLPAGEPLEFQVWHESGGAAGNGLVGTTPDVPDLKWYEPRPRDRHAAARRSEGNQSRRAAGRVQRLSSKLRTKRIKPRRTRSSQRETIEMQSAE